MAISPLVTNNGTILIVSGTFNAGESMIGRVLLDAKLDLVLESVVAYFPHGSAGNTFLGALNFRQDLLIVLIRSYEGPYSSAGGIVETGGTLPPTSTLFQFSSIVLALTVSLHSNILYTVTSTEVAAYSFHSTFSLLGTPVPSNVFQSYRASAVADNTRLYIQIQIFGASPNISFVLLDAKGRLSGNMVPLELRSAMAEPLALCSRLLMIPGQDGFTLYPKTPVGLRPGSWTQRNQNTSSVLRVDSATCSVFMQLSALVISVTTPSSCSALPTPNGVVSTTRNPKIVMLDNSTLFMTIENQVSIAWWDQGELQLSPVTTIDQTAYVSTTAPQFFIGTYAYAIYAGDSGGMGIAFGLDTRPPDRMVITRSDYFELAYINTSHLAVAYADYLEVFTGSSAVDQKLVCSMRLESPQLGCSAWFMPSFLAPAANGSLVMVRFASCDSIWILHQTPDGCYNRSSLKLLEDVASSDILPALNPDGSLLYLTVVSKTNRSGLQLFSFDMGTKNLALLTHLDDVSSASALAASYTFCAVATEFDIKVFSVSNGQLTTNVTFNVPLSYAIALEDSPPRLYAINSRTGQLQVFDLGLHVSSVI
jgi:hypothetical protein